MNQKLHLTLDVLAKAWVFFWACQTLGIFPAFEQAGTNPIAQKYYTPRSNREVRVRGRKEARPFSTARR